MVPVMAVAAVRQLPSSLMPDYGPVAYTPSLCRAFFYFNPCDICDGP